jgi:hypothetical protein
VAHVVALVPHDLDVTRTTVFQTDGHGAKPLDCRALEISFI